MRVFEKAFLILIFLLFIPISYAQNCYDPDNGLNYSRKTCITFYGIQNFYCDNCMPNSNRLIEIYCQEDNLILTKYDCPDSCQNGACVSITTVPPTTTTVQGPRLATTTTTVRITTTEIITTTSLPEQTTTSTTVASHGETPLSCTGSPSHGCSKETDIISVDSISVPDSANCGENVEVNVKWTGFHGVRDYCEPNYWAFFLETSPSSYSFLDSCESFNNEDCQLPDNSPNTYIMKYSVKMPDKGIVSDGVYNIFVTGETYGGYCNPDENNADVQLSATINLENCGSEATTTTSTVSPTVLYTTAHLTTTTVQEMPKTVTSTTFMTTTEITTTTGITANNRRGGSVGGARLLNITSILVIAVVIALIGLGIILGIMKLTKVKDAEPIPQYNEKNKEGSFY